MEHLLYVQVCFGWRVKEITTEFGEVRASAKSLPHKKSGLRKSSQRRDFIDGGNSMLRPKESRVVASCSESVCRG